MKQIYIRSMSIAVLVLALVASAPLAIAADGSSSKAQAAPKAAGDKAESAPNEVCEPTKDVAEFNTLEDLYVGAAVDFLSLIALAPTGGVGGTGNAQKAAPEADASVIWLPAPRD